jgi:hypothetical protein
MAAETDLMAASNATTITYSEGDFSVETLLGQARDG